MEDADIAKTGYQCHIVWEITRRRWQIWGPRVTKGLNMSVSSESTRGMSGIKNHHLEDAGTKNFFYVERLMCRVFSTFYGVRCCRPASTRAHFPSSGYTKWYYSLGLRYPVLATLSHKTRASLQKPTCPSYLVVSESGFKAVFIRKL